MKQFLLLPFLFAVSDRSWLADQLDKVMQNRLQTPPMSENGMSPQLGMSRMVLPNSYGNHFSANPHNIRDFVPENENERALLAQMEEQKLEVGLYLFGQAIVDQPYTNLNYRALKGPAIITKGTKRPPLLAGLLESPAKSDPDVLPTWREAYPIGQRAMRSFLDGGHGFETKVGWWTIAARPAIASDARCVSCHISSNESQKIGEPIGGILYAYKTRS